MQYKRKAMSSLHSCTTKSYLSASLRHWSFILVFFASSISAPLAPPAKCPVSGQIVRECNDKKNLGQLKRLGDEFTPCTTHRGNLFRLCDRDKMYNPKASVAMSIRGEQEKTAKSWDRQNSDARKLFKGMLVRNLDVRIDCV